MLEWFTYMIYAWSSFINSQAVSLNVYFCEQEGSISMWGMDLRGQRSIKTGTDSCKARDLWVTHFVPLQNLNKIALSFTSKEIGEGLDLRL